VTTTDKQISICARCLQTVFMRDSGGVLQTSPVLSNMYGCWFNQAKKRYRCLYLPNVRIKVQSSAVKSEVSMKHVEICSRCYHLIWCHSNGSCLAKFKRTEECSCHL